MRIAVGTVLLLAGLAAAQDKTPVPQKEHEWLKQLEGEWVTEAEGVIAPDQPPIRGKGTETTRLLGGLWAISEMKGEVMGTQMAGQMTAGKEASGDFPKVTATGKTETIAGYTCHHWLFGDQQNTDICMAKGLGYYGGGGQAGGILEKLKNLGLGDKMKAQIAANPELAKFVEGGAFPLKIAQIENGQSKTIMEVTSIERKSVDESVFNVPADYKKVEIPGMMGPSGGKK